MSKAILVIDMPDACIKCPCFQFGMDNYCAVTDKTVYDYEKGIDADCPLKPLPKKLEVMYGGDEQDWEKGYNSCIEEIVGE